MSSKSLAIGPLLVVSMIAAACSSGTTGNVGDGGASEGGSSGSSGSSSGSSGSSGAPGAKARVVIESTIAAGTHAAKECGKTGTFLTIGSFGTPGQEPVRTVDDGAAEQSGVASVMCSVKANGASFDVSGTAMLTGATGGALTVTGSFRSEGEQNGIAVSLTRMGETFASNSCVARFETPSQAVASGRVWAVVECANAERPSAQQICMTRTQLRFENCAQ